MNNESQPIFFYNDHEVGYFVSGEYPCTPGDVEYMPFRGPGHFEMQQSLNSRKVVECVFNHHGREYRMQVESCPEYGVLRVSGISSEISS